MAELVQMLDPEQWTETHGRLLRRYSAEAIEFLYAVMTDEDEEMTERVEAAKCLLGAGVNHAP
jgi:hypothetical protein